MIALLVAVVGVLESAEANRPFDPGPAVGDRLPAIAAVDQDGRTRTFESLRGPRGLFLLFFRSADW